MAGPQRTPPRFVPTLTAIVDLPASAQAELPDLTTVNGLQASPAEPVVGLPHEELFSDPVAKQTFQPEKQLVHRVMQQVDLTLEQRLGDAVSVAVRQQFDVMLPRLREEIEQVVRLAIVDALAREFPGNTGSVPSQTHRSLG